MVTISGLGGVIAHGIGALSATAFHEALCTSEVFGHNRYLTLCNGQGLRPPKPI